MNNMITKHNLEMFEERLESTRMTIITTKSYLQIKQDLESQMGRLDAQEIESLSAKNIQDKFIHYLESHLGNSGFAIFHSLNQGEGMTLLGTPMKGTYYLIGNVQIAQKMFALEPALGLRIPIRVAVSETVEGKCRIDYDLPSSLLGAYSALKNSQIPKVLDQKFNEFLILSATNN